MSDNWIVQNLNSALSTWSEKMAELWTLLTENPATFKGGGIWRIMVNINDALTAIAYGLLVLFFAAGIIKTCGSFTDLKKPEHVLKAFIRFALAQGAITYGMELMQALFSIVQGIVTTVMSGSSMAECSKSICIRQSPRFRFPHLQENPRSPLERTLSVLM